ncbi:hypothetical protein DFH27DRAFT_567685 [Peziza echinospora]|nr:hypothetical protein DFH27DRAFT_587611 [Peziza echinospora]KAI5793898.1 hypothetical protein DFH27DRAFT_567685 [Peziza echinospora]
MVVMVLGRGKGKDLTAYYLVLHLVFTRPACVRACAQKRPCTCFRTHRSRGRPSANCAAAATNYLRIYCRAVVSSCSVSPASWASPLFSAPSLEELGSHLEESSAICKVLRRARHQTCSAPPNRYGAAHSLIAPWASFFECRLLVFGPSSLAGLP